jgi:hypothetical protein
MFHNGITLETCNNIDNYNNDETKIASKEDRQPILVSYAEYILILNSINLKHFHTIYTSWLMDMYVLLRTCTSPESQLLVLYAGDEHCKTIINMLTKTFNYTCGMSIISDTKATLDPVRCVDFKNIQSLDNELNLQKILAKTF